MTDFLPLRPEVRPPQTTTASQVDHHDARLEEERLTAQKLEATFLAEMLKAAGFGEQENSFSGGPGEDQFASFHRQAIADRIAAGGGLGLSEHFLRAMLETQNDT
ncbi:MAG: rod-binding protein [Pseudomonadota bacterium]